MNTKLEGTEILSKCVKAVFKSINAYSAFVARASGGLHVTSGLLIALGIVDAIISIFASGVSLLGLVGKVVNRLSERGVLQRFGRLRSGTLCPFARQARFYGGRLGKRQSIRAAVEGMLPRLVEFTKVAKKRKLDGFIVELPANRFAAGLPEFVRSFNALLRELARLDPSGENCFDVAILNKDWQFTFNRTRFFVTSFAPFYGPRHPRFSKARRSAFVFLQPEYSFDNHGISKRNAHREEVKKRIRLIFRKAGSSYSVALIKQPFEALKYVKPLRNTDSPVCWWDAALIE